MGLLSSLACVLMAWEILARRDGSYVMRFVQAIRPSRSATYIALAVLPLAFLGQIALLLCQVRYDFDPNATGWGDALPLAVYDGKHGTSVFHPLFSALGLGIGVVETMSLGVVVLALARGVDVRSVLVVSAACFMAFLAVIAPAMSTLDPYEFVAAGILKGAAYAPPSGALHGSVYETLDRIAPIRGVIYGPLWLLINGIETSFGSSVVEKLVALRIANVGLVLTLLQIFRVAGFSRAMMAAVAINPAMWFYVVLSPHADIQAFVLLAGSFYFARKGNGVAAAVLIAAAGLIKIPFAIIGGTTLLPIRDDRRRIVLWTISMALMIVVSVVATGSRYAHDFSAVVKMETHGHSTSGWIVNAVLVSIALAGIVFWRTSLGGAALLFNQIGPVATPWYFFWGIPYAIASGRGVQYLVALPLVTTFAEDMFELTLVTKIFVVIVAEIVVVDQLLRPRVAKTIAAR